MTNRPLDLEITTHRSDIRTTQWSVSIGEIFSMYSQGRLEINPAFQRFFRWSPVQRSYLVESILLGLPIPPLFFAQSEEGQLEVVDGVQRLSTLLQLAGLLRSPEGHLREPLVLAEGQYLKHLAGLAWNEDTRNRAAELTTGTLTEGQRSDVLFSKLDATIIQRVSSGQAKYDVFRRLNSYGEPLTPQEMRAALIASENGDCLSWLSGLARAEGIPELLALSERQLDRQYDVELVLRFFFLVERDTLRVSDLRDFSAVLDEYGLELASEFPSRRTDRLTDVWNQTMTLVSEGPGGAFFRRYSPTERRFKGPFLNTSFEALGSAIGYWLYRDEEVAEDLDAAARDFWKRDEMQDRFATGKSTETRLSSYVPVGRELLSR